MPGLDADTSPARSAGGAIHLQAGVIAGGIIGFIIFKLMDWFIDPPD